MHITFSHLIGILIYNFFSWGYPIYTINSNLGCGQGSRENGDGSGDSSYGINNGNGSGIETETMRSLFSFEEFDLY